MTQQSKSARPRIFLMVCCGYVLGVGFLILWWNHAEGGLIQSWHQEYYPDGKLVGSGKWRRHYDFRNFALFFGTWVYPLSLLAAFQFGRLGIKDSIRTRMICTLFGGMCLWIFYRFVTLGVFTSVSVF